MKRLLTAHNKQNARHKRHDLFLVITVTEEADYFSNQQNKKTYQRK